MKILICVLASQRPPYPSLQDASKKTWASVSVPGIEIVFYYGQPVRENTGVDYYFDIYDEHCNLAEKTMMAFEYFLNNKDFDYLFRINSSCYVDQNNLMDWLTDKPRTDFYAGRWALGKEGYHFMLGSGYILSRDVVSRLVDNKKMLNKSLPDDVSIGKLCSDISVKPYTKFPYSVITYGQSFIIDTRIESDQHISDELTKETLNGLFCFRCNSAPNRNIDIKIMDKLFSVLCQP